MSARRTAEAGTQAERVLSTPADANGDRSGRESKEVGAGYLFWGVTIGVILLVELAGALGGWLEKHIGVHVPWTTISGMCRKRSIVAGAPAPAMGPIAAQMSGYFAAIFHVPMPPIEWPIR